MVDRLLVRPVLMVDRLLVRPVLMVDRLLVRPVLMVVRLRAGLFTSRIDDETGGALEVMAAGMSALRTISPP